MSAPPLSVVIPARDEAQALPLLLEDLAPLRAMGAELILVDGGSHDGTPQLAEAGVDRVIHSEPGRARQMNAGARVASGRYLWFLHADTRVPATSWRRLLDVLAVQPAWGRFDVHLSGNGPSLRLIGSMISLRSRLTGVASGDQGIFISRDLFVKLGGYADMPLMEDLELCRRLKRLAPPRCLRPPLVTSSRRWEQRGIWRTVWLMWRLRLSYYFGASPERLAQRYYGGPRS